jgi:hypothetical protein
MRRILAGNDPPRGVLLEQALDALGWSWWEHEHNVLTVSGPGTLCLDEGQAVIPQTAQGRLNELKQQYSKQAPHARPPQMGAREQARPV